MFSHYRLLSNKKTLVFPILFCIVFFCIFSGCKKKEPTLQYGYFKSATGMEIILKEDTIEVRNYDFSNDERFRVEEEYNYQFTEYGLSDGKKERSLKEIDDDTDMNKQFIGQTVNYTTQIDGDNNDIIGIYCAINGLTTWLYFEYFPATNSIVYTPKNYDSINLIYQGANTP